MKAELCPDHPGLDDELGFWGSGRGSPGLCGSVQELRNSIQAGEEQGVGEGRGFTLPFLSPCLSGPLFSAGINDSGERPSCSFHGRQLLLSASVPLLPHRRPAHSWLTGSSLDLRSKSRYNLFKIFFLRFLLAKNNGNKTKRKVSIPWEVDEG